MYILKNLFKKKKKEYLEGKITILDTSIILHGKSDTKVISKETISEIKQVYIESYKIENGHYEIAIYINFHKSKEYIVVDSFIGFNEFYKKLFKFLNVYYDVKALHNREAGPIKIYPK